MRLRSSDNQEFEVNESAAIQSVKLKKMIEDDCADEVIPLPDVTSHILFKVIEYCNKHAEPTGPGDAVGATNKSAEDWLKIFDADFVNAEQDSLIDLMLAASVLNIKGLVNLTRQTVTDMVKGKMPEGKVKILEKLSTASTSALTTTMSSKQKDMAAKLDAYWAQMEETSMELLNGFADYGEECRELGHRPEIPPLEIVNHPELLERAWGWDSILPYFPVNSWPLYMTYLQEYYKRNSPEVLACQVEGNAASGPKLNGDDGNDVASLFNLCINLEDQLLNMLKNCDKEHNVDEISLKDKLTDFAHQTSILEYTGFSTTSVALQCIMAETCLLFELLKTKTGMVPQVTFCSRIRKVAFGFMTYKGPRCIEAAATMMAITKEAKVMRELLEKISEEINDPFSWSIFVRERTFDAMFSIWEECSAVKEFTGGCTASKLISDESGNKNASDKDTLLQRNKMNQNIPM